MSEAMQTPSVELNTTMAADSEKYGDPDGCQHCGHSEFLLIEINASAGRRKFVQSCWECAEAYREAPSGLYDPTVLGYTDGADYDGF